MTVKHVNYWRAEAAYRGVKAFAQKGYGDLEDLDNLTTAAGDLLCNLMHLFHQRGHLPDHMSFERILERAGRNFEAEIAEEGPKVSSFSFSRLRQVEKETFRDSCQLLINSGTGYENDSTDTKTQLVLDTFVEGNLILRVVANTETKSRRHYHDPIFFESLAAHMEGKNG